MRQALPALALCGIALAACGGSESGLKQPPVSAFADGTCRVAAPDVLAIGKAGSRLGSKNTVTEDVKTDLKDAQQSLRTVAEGAEATYKPALDKLVESVGFVRIRADGNGYEPALGRQMMADYAAVLRLCGAGPKGRQ